jgi:starvation-inducible DNA-binding protein
MATETLKQSAATNIGLNEKDRAGTSQLLNHLLADEYLLYEYLLYTKTRYYHWNVTGPRFHSLHLFFETQYTALDEIIDQVAERVRQLGFFAFGTLEQFKKVSRLSEDFGTIPSEDEMIRNLTEDHETIIKQLRKDLEKADENFHDAGTNDFLTGLLEQHEKMAWMLRAHLQ